MLCGDLDLKLSPNTGLLQKSHLNGQPLEEIIDVIEYPKRVW